MLLNIFASIKGIKMSRVCFVLNSFNIGGIERVIVTLANGLSKKNEVDLLVLKNSGSLKSTLNNNVNTIDLNNLKARFLLPHLLKYLKKYKPDFLVTSIYPISIQAVLAIRLAQVKTKLVVTHHALFDIEHSGTRFHNFLLKQTLKYFYNKADITLAVSKGVYEFLQGIGIKNVRIMYNPIDINEKKKNAEILQEDISNYKPYFMFLGRLTPVKNIELIIKSFSELRKNSNFKKYNLLIIGSGPDEEMLKKLCTELYLNEYCYFLGNKTYPEFYIKNAELVLMASLSEAMPVTVMESFSLDVPIVTTPARGCLDIFELIDYKYSTTTFDDPIEYAELVKRVLDEKDLICGLSKKIEDNYGVAKIINLWNDLFVQLKEN